MSATPTTPEEEQIAYVNYLTKSHTLQITRVEMIYKQQLASVQAKYAQQLAEVEATFVLQISESSNHRQVRATYARQLAEVEATAKKIMDDLTAETIDSMRFMHTVYQQMLEII